MAEGAGGPSWIFLGIETKWQHSLDVLNDRVSLLSVVGLKDLVLLRTFDQRLDVLFCMMFVARGTRWPKWACTVGGLRCQSQVKKRNSHGLEAHAGGSTRTLSTETCHHHSTFSYI